jgi:hypothetical protein
VKEIESGLDIRPSIAVAKAYLKMSELDDTARKGDIVVDGSIMLNKEWTGVERGWALRPRLNLCGVAERFGMYVIVSFRLYSF